MHLLVFSNRFEQSDNVQIEQILPQGTQLFPPGVKCEIRCHYRAFGRRLKAAEPKQAKLLSCNGQQIKTRAGGLLLPYLFSFILLDYFGKVKLQRQCSEVL